MPWLNLQNLLFFELSRYKLLTKAGSSNLSEIKRITNMMVSTYFQLQYLMGRDWGWGEREVKELFCTSDIHNS